MTTRTKMRLRKGDPSGTTTRLPCRSYISGAGADDFDCPHPKRRSSAVSAAEW